MECISVDLHLFLNSLRFDGNGSFHRNSKIKRRAFYFKPFLEEKERDYKTLSLSSGILEINGINFYYHKLHFKTFFRALFDGMMANHYHYHFFTFSQSSPLSQNCIEN